MFQNYRRFKQTKACTAARHNNYCITVWGYKGSRILRIKKGCSNNNIEQVKFTH